MSDAPSTAPPRRTALHAAHVARGAVFTEFGGWQLPLRYGSELAEHRAVRETAGLFDISHMAEFVVAGGSAADLLDHALTARVSALPEGGAAYSLMLARDGGVLDDVIVYRTGGRRYLVIANAGNREAVAAALARACETWPGHGAPTDPPTVQDVSDENSLLALQGPRAAEILASLPGLELDAASVEALPPFACTHAGLRGERLLVARTGYTGEDGFELLVPDAVAEALWNALLEAGAPAGLVPAGLAARDTLRLEAGMPLYGHELSRRIRPAQAGLSRAVALDKPDFVGKDGLVPPADAPVRVGLVSGGRRAGRAGYPVHDLDGTVVGEITSGALSPTLGRPIALALVVPHSAAPGTALTIDIRGSRIPATVTPLPFYRRKR